MILNLSYIKDFFIMSDSLYIRYLYSTYIVYPESGCQKPSTPTPTDQLVQEGIFKYRNYEEFFVLLQHSEALHSHNHNI